MPFRYEKLDAIDDERNVRIGPDFRHGARRGRAFPHTFQQGSVEFGFQVVFVSGKTPFTNKAGEKSGFAQVTYRAGILEDTFSMGVARGREKAGLPPCTKDEYASYKQIVIEGMITRITHGGSILHYAPIPEVEFIEDETDYLMKYLDITHSVNQE